MKKRKRIWTFLSMLFCCLSLSPEKITAQDKVSMYRYSIDLTTVTDDKIRVELELPLITDSVAWFKLPKVIPGTYMTSDFGDFISSFEALDNTGNKASVTKTDDNTWQISTPQKVKKIIYYVDDTWDDITNGRRIYGMAGSSFERGQAFLLNSFCLFGYFQNYTGLPYQVTIIKPDSLYCTTPLANNKKDSTDVLVSPDYHKLVDSPIMYCVPDTASFTAEGTKFIVSVFSPHKKISADYIMQNIEDEITYINHVFKDDFNISNYNFIFYMEDTALYKSNGYGALEHSSSSLYFLPDIEESSIIDEIKSDASHELLHLLSPFQLRPESIKEFNYDDNSTMSKHLWLYEGVTEYLSNYLSLKSGEISSEDFVDIFSSKIVETEINYSKFSLTELSENIFSEEYHAQYYDVYLKAPLIAMCMDIQLLKLSDGAQNLIGLMQKLCDQYNADKPFKEDELFDKITELSYPEIKIMIDKYIVKNNDPDFSKIFNSIGIKYNKSWKLKYQVFKKILGSDYAIPPQMMLAMEGVSVLEPLGEEKLTPLQRKLKAIYFGEK